MKLELFTKILIKILTVKVNNKMRIAKFPSQYFEFNFEFNPF